MKHMDEIRKILYEHPEIYEKCFGEPVPVIQSISCPMGKDGKTLHLYKKPKCLCGKESL